MLTRNFNRIEVNNIVVYSRFYFKFVRYNNINYDYTITTIEPIKKKKINKTSRLITCWFSLKLYCLPLISNYLLVVLILHSKCNGNEVCVRRIL